MQKSGTSGPPPARKRGKSTGILTRITRRLPHSRRRTPPGTAPGTVVTDPGAAKPIITTMRYSKETFEEHRIEDISQIPTSVPEHEVLWLNVDGLGDSEIIRKIGERFDLHPLALEDVVNVHQRPKVDDYEDFLFLVARMPLSDAFHTSFFATEQLSLFMKENVVITFQEIPGGDCFGLIRERLRRGKGRIRERGPDYLCYSVLDSLIDNYFPALERYSDMLERLEDETVLRAQENIVSQIHAIKQDLMNIRRAIWPLREAINLLLRDSASVISEETRFHLRDCYDHTVQIIELVESYRELCADLRDIYLSSMSNRMNEIMKLLTVISTIFIPLNFVAGVYGMNFDPNVSPLNMPELEWYFGYPFALTLMLLIAGSLILFFHRKGWL